MCSSPPSHTGRCLAAGTGTTPRARTRTWRPLVSARPPRSAPPSLPERPLAATGAKKRQRQERDRRRTCETPASSPSIPRTTRDIPQTPRDGSPDQDRISADPDAENSVRNPGRLSVHGRYVLAIPAYRLNTRAVPHPLGEDLGEFRAYSARRSCSGRAGYLMPAGSFS